MKSYPFKESWNEASVNRNNVNVSNYDSTSSYVSTQTFSGSPYWWVFDITQTVKAWKNGSFGSGAYGILLKNTNETNSDLYRNFLGTEYSSTSYRPYITFTYTPTITLSATEITIPVGGTYQLYATTNPPGVSFFWASIQTNLASVSSTGLVTAHAAGTAYIVVQPTEGTGVACKVNICDRALTISQTTLTIYAGDYYQLTATTNPPGLPVKWIVENGSAVTIGINTGIVYGANYGSEYVRAYYTFSNGETVSAYCTVYVRMADGVYYIKNKGSGLYMSVENGGIANYTKICQYPKNTSHPYNLQQMWKIKYLGEGFYSIRPMSKLNMGLDVTGSNADIYNIGTNDTLSGVPSYARWTIQSVGLNRYIKNNGSNSASLQVVNGSTSSGAYIIPSTYSSTQTKNQWSFEIVENPPCDISFFDTGTQAINTYVERSISVFDVKTLNDLKLVPIFYSATDITQNVTWSSSNPSIATVDTNSGTVTGISAGPVVITASKVIAGTSTTVIESYFLLVTKYSLTFGFSTDDYVDGCQYGNRGSTYYANVAYNNFIIDPAYTSIFEKYRIAHSNSTIIMTR